MEYIQVITTTDKKETAERIAEVLLARRLAGCVQILGPMRSLYWWQGKIQRDEEYLCLIKTRKDLYEEVERTIKELHPYDVPEIIALPILKGNPAYLQWLSEETQGNS